jgi:hypothetical protein
MTTFDKRGNLGQDFNVAHNSPFIQMWEPACWRKRLDRRCKTRGRLR